MELKLFQNEYKVVRLNGPLEKQINGIYFYSETEDEYSLVCEQKVALSNSINEESEYRMFRIQGSLDFSLIGIISRISTLLANKNISVFVVSTFDTDYFLVKSTNLQETIQVLTESGYQVF